MAVIRTIIFQAYMWLELLLLMFVWLRVQWANKFSPREKRDALVDKIVRNWAKRLLFMAGAKVTVTGKENIPEGRTCVFASNHQSFFDILVLLAHLDKPHAILSKASIGKVPLIRLWMREIHCVYVDRADMKAGIEAINKMIDVINDGYSAIIFPEGTRSKTGGLLPFHHGSFKIAQRANVPLVICACSGSEQVKKNMFLRTTHVYLDVLEVVDAAQVRAMSTAELSDHARERIEKALAEREGKA